MWCATGKFSNFENFAADLKMFENFLAYSIFFKKNSTDSKTLAENLPIAHHIYMTGALWVSLKFQKKMNFIPAQLTRSALACMRYGCGCQTHALRVSWGRAPPPGLQLPVAH
jgi:hypothetical protein